MISPIFLPHSSVFLCFFHHLFPHLFPNVFSFFPILHHFSTTFSPIFWCRTPGFWRRGTSGEPWSFRGRTPGRRGTRRRRRRSTGDGSGTSVTWFSYGEHNYDITMTIWWLIYINMINYDQHNYGSWKLLIMIHHPQMEVIASYLVGGEWLPSIFCFPRNIGLISSSKIEIEILVGGLVAMIFLFSH